MEKPSNSGSLITKTKTLDLLKILTKSFLPDCTYKENIGVENEYFPQRKIQTKHNQEQEREEERER